METPVTKEPLGAIVGEKDLERADYTKLENIDYHTRQILAQHREEFSGAAQVLLQKYLNRLLLLPVEQDQLHEIIAPWWEYTYGSSYDSPQERRRVIEKQRGSKEYVQQRLEELYKIVKSFSKDNQADQKVFRESFLQRFPDEKQTTTLVFELASVLKDTNELNRQKSHGEMRLRQLVNTAEYRLILINYILNNNHDLEYLKSFWNILSYIGAVSHEGTLFHKIRNNVVTEAAAFVTLDKAGLAPALPRPLQDIQEATDIIIRDGRELVQVKGSPFTIPFLISLQECRDERVLEELTARLPIPKLNRAQRQTSYILKDFLNEALRVETQHAQTRPVHLFAIPRELCDQTTALPHERVVYEAKSYFKTH